MVPYSILHVCDYDGSYEEFDLRFQDYPGQVVNVPLAADHKPLSLRQVADIFKRPIMGGLDRHGVLSTGRPDEVNRATLEVLGNAPANFILGANCTVDRKTSVENLRTCLYNDGPRVQELGRPKTQAWSERPQNLTQISL